MESAHVSAMSKSQFLKEAIQEFEGPLVGYVNTILNDLERSKDVVQDTFIKLYQQDPQKFQKGAKSWLYTVSRNRALDVLRKEKRAVVCEESSFRSIPSESLSPDESLRSEETKAELMECLQHLSDNQREVILLKFQQGLSYKEISETTGLTSSNVGFLLHTGLKKLKDFLPEGLMSF